MYDPVLSDELQQLIYVLIKKDKQLLLILNKKIKQICLCDEAVIDENFKNLRYDLSDYKRVHINKSFVLLFKIDNDKKKVYFFRLAHHDSIYKK